MDIKKLPGRYVPKGDTEANWNKAVGFVPLKKEIIIYLPDETHRVARFKIGDGETPVQNLDFAGADMKAIEKLIDEKGELLVDYVDNAVAIIPEIQRKIAELEGRIIILNCLTLFPTMNLNNLGDVSWVDWGDGTINKELSHVYQDESGYGEHVVVKIYNPTQIGYGAFGGYVQGAYVGSNVTSFIGVKAFTHNPQISSVTLPDNIHSVDMEAFAGCVSLHEIIMPGVESIGSYTFSDCYSLKNITLPPDIGFIGTGAFRRCKTLQSVRFTSNKAIECTYVDWFIECPQLKYIYVPYGTGQQFRAKWAADGAPQDILDKIVESDREAMMSDIEALNFENGIPEHAIQQKHSLANGARSVAFGGGITTPEAEKSFTMGASVAKNNCTFAANEYTTAAGWASTTFGGQTKTVSPYQLALGYNNIGKEGTLLEIGNGKMEYSLCDPKPSYEEAMLTLEYYTKTSEDGGYSRITPVNTSKEHYNSIEEVYKFTGESSNAVEVYADGRMKVYGAPTEPEDVVRLGDAATTTTLGLMMVGEGLIGSNSVPGKINIRKAEKTDIDAKTNGYKPITSALIEYATMSSLAYCKDTTLWTDDTVGEDGEVVKGTKTKACETIGATPAPNLPKGNKYIILFSNDGENITQTPRMSSLSPIAATVPVYGSSGNSGTDNGNGYLSTSAPVNPYHCATKKYVDDGFVKQVQYSKEQTIADGSDAGIIGRLYIRDRNNTENSIVAHCQAYKYTVPVRNANANFYVGTPTNQYECTNKGYVDTLIGDIGTVLEAILGV